MPFYIATPGAGQDSEGLNPSGLSGRGNRCRISILKNFHEMSRLAPSRPVKPTHSPPFLPVLLVRSFLALLNDTGGKAQIVSLARFSALPRPRWSSSFCKCLLMFPPLRPILKKRPHAIKKIKTFKTLKESIETCAGVKTR